MKDELVEPCIQILNIYSEKHKGKMPSFSEKVKTGLGVNEIKGETGLTDKIKVSKCLNYLVKGGLMKTFKSPKHKQMKLHILTELGQEFVRIMRYVTMYDNVCVSLRNKVNNFQNISAKKEKVVALRILRQKGWTEIDPSQYDRACNDVGWLNHLISPDSIIQVILLRFMLMTANFKLNNNHAAGKILEKILTDQILHEFDTFVHDLGSSIGTNNVDVLYSGIHMDKFLNFFRIVAGTNLSEYSLTHEDFEKFITYGLRLIKPSTELIRAQTDTILSIMQNDKAGRNAKRNLWMLERLKTAYQDLP